MAGQDGCTAPRDRWKRSSLPNGSDASILSVFLPRKNTNVVRRLLDINFLH